METIFARYFLLLLFAIRKLFADSIPAPPYLSVEDKLTTNWARGIRLVRKEFRTLPPIFADVRLCLLVAALIVALSRSPLLADVIFKPIYTRDAKTRCIEDWAARIQWRGRRELFNLKTPNKTAAAAKVKEIYTTLVGAEWDARLEKFEPEMQRKAVSTAGFFSPAEDALKRRVT